MAPVNHGANQVLVSVANQEVKKKSKQHFEYLV